MQPVASSKLPARPAKRTERVVTRSQTRTSQEDWSGLLEECQRTLAIIDQFESLLKKVRLEEGFRNRETRDKKNEEVAWNICASQLDQQMDVDALEELEIALEPQYHDPVMQKFLEDRKAAVSFFLKN